MIKIKDNNTDYKSISGTPLLLGAYPYYVNLNTDYSINIVGNFINGISAAYLSANDNIFTDNTLSSIDLFSEISSLSSDNPMFYGFPTAFNIIDEHNIIIDLPPVSSMGIIDVIFVTPVGYGKLTDTTGVYTISAI